MRQFRATSFLSLIWILLLQSLLVLLVFELPSHRDQPGGYGVQGFVTIPAELAFAIITAAVKLKLILVKILFALKTIGLIRNHAYRHYRTRHKRSAFGMGVEDDENFVTNFNRTRHILEAAHAHRDEILLAWTHLELAAEQRLDFDMNFCRLGVLAPYSIQYEPTSHHNLNSWTHHSLRKRREIPWSPSWEELHPDDESMDHQQEESDLVEDSEERSPGSEQSTHDSMEDLLLYFDSSESSNESGPSEIDHSKIEERMDNLEPEELEMETSSVDDYRVPVPPVGNTVPSAMPATESAENQSINNNISYAQYLSFIIGSMMQNMDGCRLLKQGLN